MSSSCLPSEVDFSLISDNFQVGCRKAPSYFLSVFTEPFLGRGYKHETAGERRTKRTESTIELPSLCACRVRYTSLSHRTPECCIDQEQRVAQNSKSHRTDSYRLHAAIAATLAVKTDVPYMFRYRRPPKKEFYTKLGVLFAFGAFCTFVGLNVADVPLPSSKLGVDSSNRTDEDEVFIFPTFSLEERIKLADLSSRIAVPYLMPWGEDERPAMFFMWHLLYRSIQPDLDHFEAQLRNISTVNHTDSGLGGAASHDVFKVVINVVEAHEGYITTSLAHFLPSAYVFSIMASAPTAQQYGRSRAHSPNMRDKYGASAEDLIAERRALAEKVAAKVEWMLANLADEDIAEGSQQPGTNGMHPILPLNAHTTASEKGGVDSDAAGLNIAEQLTEKGIPARLHPHLYLCVPQQDLNYSYYVKTAAQGLRVNYQVILYPYVALRGVRTATEFDAALRALLAQANVASFIALPWISENYNTEGDKPDQGEPALRRRLVVEQELKDYEIWYDRGRSTPLQVLQRALSASEMGARYHVALVPLGSKRWFGALRQLFRVEIVKKDDEHALNAAASSTTIAAGPANSAASCVRAGAGASGTCIPQSPPPTSLAADTFGCTARLTLLGCIARAQHSSCEKFSELHVS